MINRDILIKGSLLVVLLGLSDPLVAQLRGSFQKHNYKLDSLTEDNWLAGKLDSINFEGKDVKSDTVLSLEVSGHVYFQIDNWNVRSITLDALSKTRDNVVSILSSSFSKSLMTDVERGHVQLVNTKLDDLLWIKGNRTKIVLQTVEAHELDISFDYFEEQTFARYVSLHDVTISSDSRIYNADSIWFNGFTAKEGSVIYIDDYSTPLLIFSKLTDLRNLNFDFAKVSIRLEEAAKDREEAFLENLMQMQQLNSYFEGYKLTDIKLRSLRLEKGSWLEKHIGLPAQIWWNNFGYNKSLIVSHTATLFLFFFIVNLIFFMPLTLKVYPLEGLNNYHDTIRRSYAQNLFSGVLTTIPYSLYFSIVVFFGLRLDFKIMNLHYKVGCLYVFVQYLVGVICLAYLANLILTQ